MQNYVAILNRIANGFAVEACFVGKVIHLCFASQCLQCLKPRPQRPFAPPLANMAAQMQLASVLPAGIADVVNGMCEAAPGIPWSDAMLEDMLRDVKVCNIDGPDKDLGHCTVRGRLEYTKRGKKEELYGSVEVTQGDRDIVYLRPHLRYPATVVGMRKVLEWLQQEVAMIQRRGWCEHCEVGRPTTPIKRLRVQGTDACSRCVLARLV